MKVLSTRSGAMAVVTLTMCLIGPWNCFVARKSQYAGIRTGLHGPFLGELGRQQC